MTARWRHRKSGGTYTEVARGLIEATHAPVVVYRGEDGAVWIRPEAEFAERFDRVEDEAATGTHTLPSGGLGTAAQAAEAWRAAAERYRAERDHLRGPVAEQQLAMSAEDVNREIRAELAAVKAERDAAKSDIRTLMGDWPDDKRETDAGRPTHMVRRVDLDRLLGWIDAAPRHSHAPLWREESFGPEGDHALVAVPFRAEDGDALRRIATERVIVQTLHEDTKADLAAARALAGRLARNEYVPWDRAGGPDNCPHGIADGIPCRTCDIDTALSWREGDGK